MLIDSVKNIIVKLNAAQAEIIPRSKFIHLEWALNHFSAEWKWKVTVLFFYSQAKGAGLCNK